ncbi:ATP pyrophosphate-lyase 9 [Intoshia linei]|uniref:Adenylate cyclase type 9 n=1 Tax=Intoshia linei TaxID=1819745 RepID=A0A177B9U7_9BILA|nr:ATP pyrophosphate-lyase 9 [Intoshia linei]
MNTIQENRRNSNNSTTSRRSTLTNCDIRGNISSEVKYENVASDEGMLCDMKDAISNNVTKNKKPKFYLFDRASGYFWDSHFESKNLEVQYEKCFKQTTSFYFQIFIYFLIFLILLRTIFVAIIGSMIQFYYIHLIFLTGIAFVLAIILSIMIFKYKNIGQKMNILTAIIFIIHFLFNIDEIFITGYMHLNKENDLYMRSMAYVSNYIFLYITIFLFYILVPIKLKYLIVLNNCIFMIYEIFFYLIQGEFGFKSYNELHHTKFQQNYVDLITKIFQQKNYRNYLFILSKVVIILILNCLSIYINVMNDVHRRSTFLNVSQSLMLQKQLKIEDNIKNQVIHSLMPPKIALEVIKQKPNTNKSKQSATSLEQMPSDQQSNVTVIFADIVGFTKMSSNKTAERLVFLLNDLFGRFDEVCLKSGCEKIATLGDCYYAVAGCPEPISNHATSAVECGLGMIKAIKEFDEDHDENVHMRIGIHTGKVLYGVIGTTRFKFDVWSNDVTLANIMESEGLPGRVHISECTADFITEEYELEFYKELVDIRSETKLIEKYSVDKGYIVTHDTKAGTIKTYLIVNRKNKQTITPSCSYRNLTISKDETDQPTTGKTNMLDLLEKLYCYDKDLNEINDAFYDDYNKSSESSDSENCKYKNYEKNDKLSSNKISKLTQEKKISMFFKMPPINKILLKFKSIETEKIYKKKFGNILLNKLKHDLNNFEDKFSPRQSKSKNKKKVLNGKPLLKENTTQQYSNNFKTMESPLIMQIFEYIIINITSIFIILLCFINFSRLPIWLYAIFAFFQIVNIMCASLLIYRSYAHYANMKVLQFTKLISTNWTFYHIIGIIAIINPFFITVCYYQCFTFSYLFGNLSNVLYFCIFATSLLSLCTFTVIMYYIKICIALVASLIMIILYSTNACYIQYDYNVINDYLNLQNSTNSNFYLQFVNKLKLLLANTSVNYTNQFINDKSHSLASETYNILFSVYSNQLNDYTKFTVLLDITLAFIALIITILIVSLVMECEYRKTFYRTINAIENHEKIKIAQNESDWLLNNIIPEYVLAVLSKKKKYSESISNVGVIFANITNFCEFYEEGFYGGKHYIQVLNQIFADFEILLKNPKYHEIEKIKTIGSCFMAASGLNKKIRSTSLQKNAHLIALLEFSQELQATLNKFNTELFNFNFNMSIGFNVGSVVAGVIGNTKLSYDIWGDAVNLSSRMYSTAQTNTIQVTEEVAKLLKDHFEFEYRGIVAVKGKGNMKTYTVINK